MAAYDVVVIGAGLSGLVAAYTILKDRPSTKLVLLESSDHIGGQIDCREMKTANGTGIFDIGAGSFGSAQEELCDFINEVGLETYEMYDKGNRYWQLADGEIKKYGGSMPPIPMRALPDLYRYFKKVDALSKQVNLENPSASKHADEWDRQTFEEYRHSILWTEAGRQSADVLAGSFVGTNISELKMMQYLYLIASDGGWDNHSDTDGKRKSNLKIKGGFMQLCNELVQSINESTILKNESVTSVEQNESLEEAIVKTLSGKEFCAKRVICAVAENHIGAIEFKPSLVTDRSAAFPRTISTISCVLSYATAFWRDDGYVGEMVSMSGSLGMLAASDDHPVVGVFDHMNGDLNPALTVLMGAPGLRKKTAEERKQIAMTYVRKLFGDKAMEPLDYQDLIWNNDYRGPLPTREVKPSEALSSLRTPHGCIHWAGSHTSTSWNSSLAGALHAGRRAANEVVTALI